MSFQRCWTRSSVTIQTNRDAHQLPSGLNADSTRPTSANGNVLPLKTHPPTSHTCPTGRSPFTIPDEAPQELAGASEPATTWGETERTGYVIFFVTPRLYQDVSKSEAEDDTGVNDDLDLSSWQLEDT